MNSSLSEQLGGEPPVLNVSDKDGQLGTIALEAGTLTGSSASMQAIADSALRRSGGDARAAYRLLDGWSNGYVWAHP
jgi:hypothetical protein